MLRKIESFSELDSRKLMNVYAEGNEENAEYFYPNEPDRAAAVKRVETNFLGFLKKEFYSRPGSVYWVLEEDGEWVSALRASRIREGLYYLEALETRPDRRREGFAARLLTAVTQELKIGGPFRLYDCVSRRNAASLKTHERCGFRIASDPGHDYLRDRPDEGAYGLMYGYESEAEA